MADWKETAVDLARRLIAGPDDSAEPGEPTVGSALEALSRLVAAAPGDLPIGGDLGEGIGLALGGDRVTVSVDAGELTAGLPALREAVRLRAPLLLLATPSRTGEPPLPWSELAAAGVPTLLPGDVQEAVDLAVVGRRVAEELLLPVAMVLDSSLADTIQDLRLPSSETLGRFLGEPDDPVHPPTPDQKLLFGSHRRRVPRWSDPDRPLRLGSPPGRIAGPASLSRELFLRGPLADALGDAMLEWERTTGRPLARLSTRSLSRADLVLLVPGAAGPVAEAVASHLRAEERSKVGAVGIRSLHPFPAADLVEVLAGRPLVAVVEPTDLAGESDGLLERIRAALEAARENARLGAEASRELPSLADRDLPRLIRATVSAPVAAADLTALAREILRKPRSPVWTGAGSPDSSRWPKRRARRDLLLRDYPKLRELEIVPASSPPDLAPEGARTMGILRSPDLASGPGHPLASLLHGLLQGHLRCRAPSSETGSEERLETVTWAPEPLPDPGPDVRLDLLFLSTGVQGRPGTAALLDRISEGGALLLPDVQDRLPEEILEALRERSLELWTVSESADPDPGGERLLGAIAKWLARDGLDRINTRRLLSARKEALRELPGTISETEIDRRLAELGEGFEGLRRVSPANLRPIRRAPVARFRPPADALRADGAGTIADLPDFWDQIGVVDREAGYREILPEPRLATGAVPARSALLAPSADADRIPAFDPAVCTGCGDCWTVCPHDAVEVRCLTPSDLLDEGIRRVGKAGRSADALRMVTRKLAVRLPGALGTTGGLLGPALDEAFRSMMEESPPPEPRREAVREAFDAAREPLAALPASATDPFFHDVEAESSGQGRLLLLEIDPETCTGCGLCVEVCEPDALTLPAAGPRDRERTRNALAAAHRIATLPAPAPEALEASRETIGPLAGDLLAASDRPVLSGRDGAEPGSGSRLAARLVLESLALRGRTVLDRVLSEVRELREAMATTIHETMGRGLPDADLDSLARGLEAFGASEVDLSRLTARIETAFESGRVDTGRLRSLVDTARKIADLEDRLATDGEGRGRRPLSLVIAETPAADWAGSFPWNPFDVPTTVAESDPVAVARGLARGTRNRALADAKLLRRARLELEDPARAAPDLRALETLGWDDLSEEERELCVPVVLLAGEEDLHSRWGDLLSLLSSDLEVGVLLLEDTDLRRSDPDSALPALSLPGLPVARSSVAFRSHLSEAVDATLRTPGPGLLLVPAPSPRGHGFPPDATLDRARRAVETRTAPLFVRRPGEALSLDGNPDPERLWTAGTPAHQALGETRFAELFRELDPDAPRPTALESWLELEAGERREATPIVETDAGSRVPDRALLAAVEGRVESWKTLRELADLTPAAPETPDPEELEALQQRHARELEALRAQLRAREAQLSRDLRVEMARKVRIRLLEAMRRSRETEPGNGHPEDADPPDAHLAETDSDQDHPGETRSGEEGLPS